MFIEKDYFEMIQNNSSIQAIFSNRIEYLEIEEKGDLKFPFLVIQPINLGTTVEVNFNKPLFQLDVYSNNKYKVSEIANAVIDILKYINGNFGTCTFSHFKSERRKPLRLEKDLWKVPIDSTCNCSSNT